MASCDLLDRFSNLDKGVQHVQWAGGELRRNLKVISASFVLLVKRAEESQFKGVRANGYWAFIKLCEKFFELIWNHLQVMENHYEDFVMISRYIVAMVKLLENLEQTRACRGSVVETIGHGHFTSSSEFFNLPYKYSQELAVIFGKYPGFWLSPSLAKINQGFSVVMAMSHTPIFHYASLFWDKKQLGMSTLKALLNVDLHHVTSYMNPILRSSLALLQFVTPQAAIVSRDLQIKSSSPYVIHSINYNIEKHSSRTVAKPVKCRLLYNSRCSTQKTLVFHCHGGAFITGAPELDEAMYLREWCTKMDDIAVLSVDYGLAVSFPQLMQDVLDAYLWLLDSPDANDQLGFVPKKIVFCGDSAGAAILLSLLFMLNHITQVYRPNENIMPSSFLSIYGAFYGYPFMTPSRILSLVDNILFSNIMLTVEGKLSGIDLFSAPGSSSESSLLKTCFKTAANLVLPGSDSRTKPWCLCSEKSYEQFRQSMVKLSEQPFGCPLLYKGMEKVKVPLFLISTEFCTFVDESVTMAKMWKGPVTLDVLEGLPHGFMHINSDDVNVKQGREVCLKRLRDAINCTHNENHRIKK